ncbi:MAG: minor capsid protein, partial [Raoultibacter sp.]
TGKSYSERVWSNTARLAATLEEKITAAFLSGKSNFALEREITEQFGCSFREAERLIRTETSYVCNEAAVQSYLDSGLEAFEFLCTEDTLTCKLCGAQDGEITPLARRKIGKNAPPMHPWCRCTVLPAVESAGTERSGRGTHGETKLFPKGMRQPDYVQWLNDGAPDDVSAWMTKRKA